MNVPDRFDYIVVPDGVPKVREEKDTKLVNASTFIIEREDHTVGNLLRMQLLQDPRVRFAAYKLPHPLLPQLHVKVQAKEGSSPLDVMQDAVSTVGKEFEILGAKFEEEMRRKGEGEEHDRML